MGVELVTNGIPRSAVSVAARITRLDDEVRYHAMELLSVEVVTCRQRDEAVHGAGSLGGEQQQLDGTPVGVDSCDRHAGRERLSSASAIPRVRTRRSRAVAPCSETRNARRTRALEGLSRTCNRREGTRDGVRKARATSAE